MKRVLFFITLFVSTTLFAQTKFEKDFFDLVNLVRTNPKYVATLVQNEFNGKSRLNKDSIEGVINTLNNLPSIDPLVFDATIYENKKNNLDTSKNKNIHDFNFLRTYKYGENIVYVERPDYNFSVCPLECLVVLLIDRGHYVDHYEKVHIKITNGVRFETKELIKSSTNKAHFDNMLGDYKKTAVVVTFNNGVRVYQDFK